MGTTARIAVALAYAEIQKQLCIVGLCLCVPLLFFAFFLRDHYLDSVQSLEESEDKVTTTAKHGRIVFTDDDDPTFRFFKKIWKKVRFSH